MIFLITRKIMTSVLSRSVSSIPSVIPYTAQGWPQILILSTSQSDICSILLQLSLPARCQQDPQIFMSRPLWLDALRRGPV